VGGDVVQDLAHAVFIICKISYSTKPTIFLNISTTASFWLGPTVCSDVKTTPLQLFEGLETR
jgi:hypothetical protein